MPHLTPGAGGGCSELDWSYNARLPKRDILELGTLKFIDAREGVLRLGPPGTGKSHVGKALACSPSSADTRSSTGRRINCEDITEARVLGVLRKVRAQLKATELRFIDDLFLRRLRPTSATNSPTCL